MEKKLEEVKNLVITFTDDEIEELKLEKGAKYTLEMDGDKMIMTPYAKVEIDFDEFSKQELILLIGESVEKDISMNEVIENIIREYIDEAEDN